MEHHILYKKYKKEKEKEMKKILNLKKWIGPFFAVISLGIMCLAIIAEGWFKAMVFIAPLLSYGFTMMYSWRKNPKYSIVMTILLIGMSLSLSLANVIPSTDWYLLPGIAMLIGASIVASNMIYGFEILNGDREDNFLFIA